jgi:hypothetical protein
MNRDAAWNLANHWVAAWNAHDLDSIMTHSEALHALDHIDPRKAGWSNCISLAA